MAPPPGGAVRRRSRKFYQAVSDELIAYAQHEFWLNQPEADGGSRRAHLESASRQGRPTPELEGPGCPDTLIGVWQDFLELAGRRGMGPLGPAPLSFPDLDAWARLTRRSLTPARVALLGRLDDVWLASLHPEKGS